jgi:hypothetical protein
MIGVISKSTERKVVEEFFQLFKTPWEMFREGENYDVVLVTTSEVREVDARLVIICSSEITELEKELTRPRCKREKASLVFHGQKIPLYHEVLCFETGGRRLLCTTGTSEIAGLEVVSNGQTMLRLGFNLFAEIETLLRDGQPVKHATSPTIELHIAMLRQLIVEAGISVLEIAASPWGYDFAVCLTHDIDFVGIRRHKFDHTMWGFLYRSTVGAVIGLLRGRLSLARLVDCWKAAFSLPFVQLGLAPDFWMLFDWYMKVEKGLSPTYFFIPFKGRCGEKVTVPHAARRASGYALNEIRELANQLMQEGCELGVHGIDAWHDVGKARNERKELAAITGPVEAGIRMHWLLNDAGTHQVLDEAGYDYDSTSGYNETPGYRCGTTQVFRPLTASHLLELPLHIQDGALFYSKRLGLLEPEAWDLCEVFIHNARRFGGVLTLLWHDRSPGPERFWGEFYVRLVNQLKTLNAWFARGSEVVAWFRQRREVTFERLESSDGSNRIRLRGNGRRIHPALKIRIYSPTNPDLEGTRSEVAPRMSELSWEGDTEMELGPTNAAFKDARIGVLAISTCE